MELQTLQNSNQIIASDDEEGSICIRATTSDLPAATLLQDAMLNTSAASLTTQTMSEVPVGRVTALTELMSKIKHLTPEIETAIKEVEDTRKQLEVNKMAEELKITSVFDDMASLVSQRKMAVLAELQRVSAFNEQVLHTQLVTLQEYLQSITSCRKLALDEALGDGATDIVMAEEKLAEKIDDLLANSPILQPETNTLLTFNDQGFETLQEMITSVGSVHHNAAVPYQTSIEEHNLNGCIVGKASTVTVTSRDRNGDPVKTGLAPLTAYITSDTSEDDLHPTITDLQDGTYDVIFVLQAPGVHYLSVFLFGQPIAGSPYKIQAMGTEERCRCSSSRSSKLLKVKEEVAKRSSCLRSHGSCSRLTNQFEDDLIMKIGVKGRNTGEFSNPQGLCCHDDKVVVADSTNQCIQVFDTSGECCLKFGAPGRGPGKMQRPTGLTMNRSGNYLMADYDNKWVSVFSPDGRYQNHIGCGRVQGPKGVTVDSLDNIIVVDNKGNCVLVFQPNGKLINKFGCRGKWDEHLAGPQYAAVTKEDDVIVSDFYNHCIKVYGINGKFKFRFGSNGEGIGQFNAPTGVAVDDRGNILVADWGNSRIQVFDSSGSFLSFVNTNSEPLAGPQGLAVTSLGVVVVADSGNHCIKFYKYLQ